MSSTYGTSVRRSEPYHEAKEAVSQLHDQGNRLQRMLERLMTTGETLPEERLISLWGLPVGREILTSLILRLDNGQLGMLDRTNMMLRDAEERLHSVDDAVHVAHVYDLFQAGQLSTWQETIVHKNIVQPFRKRSGNCTF